MTTLRRPPHTVSCVNVHVQGGRAMSIDQAIDTITPAITPPAWERLVPVRRQRRWLLPVAIGAVQEFITGADNDDLGKLKDGAKKLDAALLSIGKAEAAVGADAS